MNKFLQTIDERIGYYGLIMMLKIEQMYRNYKLRK